VDLVQPINEKRKGKKEVLLWKECSAVRAPFFLLLFCFSTTTKRFLPFCEVFSCPKECLNETSSTQQDSLFKMWTGLDGIWVRGRKNKEKKEKKKKSDTHIFFFFFFLEQITLFYATS
jgi:hypothetical protein